MCKTPSTNLVTGHCYKAGCSCAPVFKWDKETGQKMPLWNDLLFIISLVAAQLCSSLLCSHLSSKMPLCDTVLRFCSLCWREMWTYLYPILRWPFWLMAFAWLRRQKRFPCSQLLLNKQFVKFFCQAEIGDVQSGIWRICTLCLFISLFVFSFFFEMTEKPKKITLLSGVLLADSC